MNANAAIRAALEIKEEITQRCLGYFRLPS